MDENNHESLIGEVFGDLTVISQGPDYIDQPSKSVVKRWICKCAACGGVSIPLLETQLRTGYIIHCGCKNTLNCKNMIGEESGYLKVTSRAPDYVKPFGIESMWICYCSGCGRETKPIAGSSLRKHHTRSCGCRVNEVSTIHGGYYDRLYRVLHGMKSRCNNENSYSYKNYGGRGIKALPDMADLSNYSEIKQFALDNGYDPNAPTGQTTINRIDNNGDYTRDNINFVDVKTQANNRRNNVIVEYQGKKYTLAQFAEFLNIEPYIVYSRYSYGWTPEQIATTPIRRVDEQEMHFDYRGNQMTCSEMSMIAGVPAKTIYERIHKHGWTVEQAAETPNTRLKKLEIDGIEASKAKWERVFGIPKDLLSRKIADGYTPLEAMNKISKNRPINAIYFIDEKGNPISEEEYDKTHGDE